MEPLLISDHARTRTRTRTAVNLELPHPPQGVHSIDTPHMEVPKSSCILSNEAPKWRALYSLFRSFIQSVSQSIFYFVFFVSRLNGLGCT